MVTLKAGQWWRESRRVESAEAIWEVSAGPVNWVFVGNFSGTPIIYTVPTANMFDLAPTYTARTPAGSDSFRGVDYVPTAADFCAVGVNGRYEASTDGGVTWAGANLGGGQTLWAVTGADDSATSRFMAVGDGEIWGADAGFVWTSRWTGSEFWRSVAYISGVGWVAVGDGGWATHSATGGAGSFSAPFRLVTGDLWKVAAGHGRYMAVGANGKAYVSATGVSGSWTEHTLPTTLILRAVVALDPTDSWVAATFGGLSFYTDDNGATWSENTIEVDRLCVGMAATAAGVAVVGNKSGVHASVDDTQTDPPDPVDTPTSEAAYGANADMSGDAVRRLITQFRSGRG